MFRGRGKGLGRGSHVGWASGGVAPGLLRSFLGAVYALCLFLSMHLPATKASAAMYWLARWSISGMVTGDFSINDQKNLEGLKNLKCMHDQRWMSIRESPDFSGKVRHKLGERFIFTLG